MVDGNTPMVNLNDISWKTLFRTDADYLEAHNGMPIEVMMNMMSKWNWQNAVLMVCDVKFMNGHPHYVRIVGFTDNENRDKEEFMAFMFSVSLTHKVMFVTNHGGIFITESDDGSTNIDANLIEGMLNAYR